MIKTSSIRELIHFVTEFPEGREQEHEVLHQHGIHVMKKEERVAFHISNQQLKKLYATSRWENANLKKIYLRLPGAREEKVYFGKVHGQNAALQCHLSPYSGTNRQIRQAKKAKNAP